MNYFEAGRLSQLARERGITADRVGLPPRPGESTNSRTNCAVVFWLNGKEFEFQHKAEAEEWMYELLNQRKVG